MYKVVLVVLILIFVISCRRNKTEESFEVAKSYCDCVEEEMNAHKDSLINIYDCEKKIFPKSRLMSIYMAFDEYNNYSQSTIDSAKKFSLEVGNIIDTLCLDKLDPKRIKKIPHIPM